jgi:tetratricopeptide (TPR) repeat protein
MIGFNHLALNRPGRAAVTLERLHGKDLPGFVTHHPLYAHSFMLLAGAHHRLGNHAAELAAARAGRERFPTHSGLMASEARARAAIGNADDLETLFATAEVTPGRDLPAAVLVAAAASADAHGHSALATDLARRAVEALESGTSEIDGHRLLLLGRALAMLGRLERAQSALEQAADMLGGTQDRASITARGWLGSIAARRGDLETAETADRSLASENDPYLYGSPMYYRSAIAAWRGHRDAAMELLREAQASGWARYYLLHDDERVLFAPLEGEESFRAMLLPAD